MALDRFPGILESPCLPVCRGVFNSGNLSTGCTPTPAPFGPDRRAQLDGVGGMTGAGLRRARHSQPEGELPEHHEGRSFGCEPKPAPRCNMNSSRRRGRNRACRCGIDEQPVAAAQKGQPYCSIEVHL